jgi:hypothetical protein
MEANRKKLALDELCVETFDVESEPLRRRGTVKGAEASWFVECTDTDCPSLANTDCTHCPSATNDCTPCAPGTAWRCV